jgi:hypothetical protein
VAFVCRKHVGAVDLEPDGLDDAIEYDQTRDNFSLASGSRLIGRQQPWTLAAIKVPSNHLVDRPDDARVGHLDRRVETAQPGSRQKTLL